MEKSWQCTLYAGALLCAIGWLVRRPSRCPPLPPGPKRLPIIGSLLDMPPSYQWLTFDKWCQQYGDIVYTEVLGTKFVILGSAKRTEDLLMGRSAIYSDRIPQTMMQLMGWDWNMATQRYGPSWRAHRRILADHFSANVVSKFNPMQMKHVRRLQKRLLDTPEEFLDHIRHGVSSIMLAVTYGIQAKDSKDPYIEIAEEAISSLGHVGPGTFLVDFLPALKYVPQWFPGAGFQRRAARWRSVIAKVVNQPWQFVKYGLMDGTAVPCVATDLLEGLPEGDDRTEQEQIAKGCAAAAYLGGNDTIISAVQSFVLAMAMYPDIQKKAQVEIDTVIGCNKLPDMDDLDYLPFIETVVKETLRWQPAIPMGVPHYSMQDDKYDEFFIPKGSMVIGNSWSILHDPNMYPEPEEFRPDRFLKDGKLNSDIRDSVAAFGYGRRICPGMLMANRSLFAIFSSILSTFDIFPPLDEFGNPTKLQATMSPGVLSFPIPFKCIIKPRSDVAAALIRDSVDAT